jgi:hypothetical protein
MFAAYAVLSPQAQAGGLSIQLVNPDLAITVQVWLDRRLVFQGRPVASATGDRAAVPIHIGSFTLDDEAKHSLVVEAASEPRVRSSFEWRGSLSSTPWVVVRFYPGRSQDREPAGFTFSLQAGPDALK